MNINDFIQNNTPKKKTSVFDEHIDDINKLLELNYSQKQVIEFLKAKCKNKKGLSEANLSKYLKKPTNENTKNNKMNKVQNTKSDITSNEEDLLNLVNTFKKLV